MSQQPVVPVTHELDLYWKRNRKSLQLSCEKQLVWSFRFALSHQRGINACILSSLEEDSWNCCALLPSPGATGGCPVMTRAFNQNLESLSLIVSLFPSLRFFDRVSV